MPRREDFDNIFSTDKNQKVQLIDRINDLQYIFFPTFL